MLEGKIAKKEMVEFINNKHTQDCDLPLDRNLCDATLSPRISRDAILMTGLSVASPIPQCLPLVEPHWSTCRLPQHLASLADVA